MTDKHSAGTPVPDHAELPLPDYDHLPASGLQHRIRTLPQEDLRSLIAYEQAHAHRPAVLETMHARLRQLESGEPPSGGSPLAAAPEHAPPAQGGSSVSPKTSGPPMNPPSHGTPENPAQPRSTG